jgi:sucrose-6-phosphate hydrolase SacC (GH32 family)
MTEAPCYEEKYRPQFHFTARENWLNDPNGCVFHNGEYHLFFQHNPTGIEWGNMTWGHAVSPDLVHWNQLPHALLPYGDGTIFSGSAVVDSANSSGFGTGESVPLVAAFTHAKNPFGQAIAFSNDNGRNWEYYEEGKHVVPNQGLDEAERDPKIFWHEPSGKWIMVLWVEMNRARFFTSDNLLDWNHSGDFEGEGFFECPDFIQLPVDGNSQNMKWVLYDAGFNYWIGTFDGKTFTPDKGPLKGDLGKNFYAAQTWNNTDNRIVQIGWMRGGEYPDMPFNQQMSFPCELFLRTISDGLRLCRMPVKEIVCLRVGSESVGNHKLEAGESLDLGSQGNLLDVELEVEVVAGSSFNIRLCGQDITWSEGKIACLGTSAEMQPSGDVLFLRILVDKTSIELFGNGGNVCMSSCFLPPEEPGSVQLCTKNSPITVKALTLHRLSSAWKKD